MPAPAEPTPTGPRPGQARAARIVGWLALAGAVGSTYLVASHAGVRLPVLGLSPTIWWVVWLFGTVAVLYAVSAAAAWRQWRGAWFVALVPNALSVAVLAVVGHDEEYVLMVVGVAAIVVLLSAPGQEALLYRSRAPTVGRPRSSRGGLERPG